MASPLRFILPNYKPSNQPPRQAREGLWPYNTPPKDIYAGADKPSSAPENTPLPGSITGGYAATPGYAGRGMGSFNAQQAETASGYAGRGMGSFNALLGQSPAELARRVYPQSQYESDTASTAKMGGNNLSAYMVPEAPVYTETPKAGPDVFGAGGKNPSDYTASATDLYGHNPSAYTNGPEDIGVFNVPSLGGDTTKSVGFTGGWGDISSLSDFGTKMKTDGLLDSIDPKTGFKTQGMIGAGLGVAQGIGNAYFAMKNYGLAKDSFNENKRQYDQNYGMQKDLAYAELKDRQDNRNRNNPGTQASWADYKKANLSQA